MSTVEQIPKTNLKDAANESVSTNSLLDTLSDVATAEGLILLAVIVICIVIVTIAIVWISCRLYDRDRRRRAQRSTPLTSVYQWNSLTSERKLFSSLRMTIDLH